jgi:hypothetical protein
MEVDSTGKIVIVGYASRKSGIGSGCDEARREFKK